MIHLKHLSTNYQYEMVAFNKERHWKTLLFKPTNTSRGEICEANLLPPANANGASLDYLGIYIQNDYDQSILV